MIRPLRRFAFALAVAVSVPAVARAEGSIHEGPHGPGTEQPAKDRTPYNRLRPGWELGVLAGGGIGLGLGLRAGYSFVPGLYAGGSATHYLGPSVGTLTGSDTETQTIVGGEFGYKFFPHPEIELRPFLFTGVGLFNHLNEATGIVDMNADFTLDPAFLAAYHFGSAFVSAETRLQAAPTPVRFAVLGGVGFGM